VTPLELLAAALVAGAVLFSVVAVVGIIRLPDVYSRAHATSKSDTAGTGLGLAAAAVALEAGDARLKLVFLAAFVLLTNPVAAHAITRAARLQGIPVAGEEVDDD
jgi:multicomponent Na+:H+ antiporter subunit G